MNAADGLLWFAFGILGSGAALMGYSLWCFDRRLTDIEDLVIELVTPEDPR